MASQSETNLGEIGPRYVSATRPGRYRRRQLVIVISLVAVIVGALGSSLVWLRRRPSPLEPLLATARVLLEEPADDPSERQDQARAAANRIGQYLVASGADVVGANLLLAAAVALRGDAAKAEQAVNAIDLTQAQAADLTTAAKIFFQVGAFVTADKLISVALERDSKSSTTPSSSRSGTAHSRERTLRTACLIRYDLGRYDDVLSHCRELAQLATRDPHPWVVIASVYEERGEWLNALTAYREVLPRVVGEDASYRMTLISFLLYTGQVDEARREFDRLQTSPLAANVLQQDPLLVPRLLYSEARYSEAKPLVEQLLQSDESSADAWLLLGRILMEEGDFVGAADALERHVLVDPLSHEGFYVLAQASQRAGRIERAQETLKTQRELSKIKVQLFRLERRATTRPNDRATRQELISIYENIGLTSRAEYWRRSLESLSEIPTQIQPPPKP